MGISALNGYSNMDIMAAQAQKRAQQLAQTQQVQQTQQTQSDESIVTTVFSSDPSAYKCTDGKDDGEIGFWSATGRFLKGATVNFVKGFLGFDRDGNWSAGNLAKNLAMTAGAIAIGALTGPVGWAVMAGIGVGMTGAGLAKSAIRVSQAASTLKSDAEAKKAWEDVGTNTTGFVLSAVGAKTAMKSYNPSGTYSVKWDTSSVSNFGKSLWGNIQGTGKAVWDSTTLPWKLAGQGGEAVYSAAKTRGWQGVKTTVSNGVTKGIETAKANWANATKPLGADKTADKYEQKITELEVEKAGASIEKQVKIQEKIDTYAAKRDAIREAYSGSKDLTRQQVQTKIDESAAKITEYKNQLASASDDAAKATINQNIKVEQAKIDTYRKVKYENSHNAKQNFAQKQKEFDNAQRNLTKAQEANNKYAVADPSDEAMLAKLHLDKAETAFNKAKVELTKAKASNSKYADVNRSFSDYVTAVRSQAESVGKNFTAMNETTNIVPFGGKKVPFTYHTIPTLEVSKSWVMPLSNGYTNSAIGGPSGEAVMYGFAGVNSEQMKLIKLMEANPEYSQHIAAMAQANQAQAAVPTQAGQIAGSMTGPTITDYQALNMALKMYGVG